MIKVLFVCLGNICRSPMAEAIFRKKVKDHGLEGKVEVDSAGTSDWHIGKRPHEGTIGILDEYEVDHKGMAGRQVIEADLETFDYIIGMDTTNMSNLHKLNGDGEVKSEMSLLLDFVPEEKQTDVPDPYFTGDFNETYELVDAGTEKLLQHIIEKEGLELK